MKKLFTIITVLITLSLIGIIVLQVSWIRNSLRLRTEQTHENLEVAMYDVQTELQEERSSFIDLSTPKNLLTNPIDDGSLFFKAPTIAQRYTTFKLYDKLKKSFEKHRLKQTKFEFAVTSKSNDFDYELQSAQFEYRFNEALEDKENNLIFYWPIYELEGSETENLMPQETLIVVISDFKKDIFKSLGWMIAGAMLFTIIILAAFYITLRALLNQKKLSEIKSDFINNMTHELKTPIATISLAASAIRKPQVVANPEKFDYFSSVIIEESKRMNLQVETILQAALLDRNEVKLTMHPYSVNDAIKRMVEHFNLQINNKNGEVHLDLSATHDVIQADDVHFTNLLNNLLDNAIKYSKEDVPPSIHIRTSNKKHLILIDIEDNGIGMNKDTQQKIFEKFYRAHTGNVHNVKGFGLGLSYVKTLVDAHAGKISVESAVGKGSHFTLEFPIFNQRS